MKLVSYKDALKMGKEKLGEMMIPVKTAKAQKQAELEMCKIDEEIAVKEAELHDTCCSEVVKFTKIIDLQDKLGLLARRKTQYQQILDEMFPS
jgi:hypothetical protein